MKFRFLILLFLFPVFAGESLSDEEATRLADGFRAALGKHLKQKLQSEGPVAAIDYCSENAMPITSRYASENQIIVRRITTRFRSAEGKLETGEAGVLADMERDAKAGALKPLYRQGPWVYQPLMIEAPCLICHGETLAEPVAEALDERYPKDKARGYALGDVRGAIAVRKR